MSNALLFCKYLLFFKKKDLHSLYLCVLQPGVHDMTYSQYLFYLLQFFLQNFVLYVVK